MQRCIRTDNEFTREFMMRDLEVQKAVEEVPKMILRMPSKNLVYVYKNVHGRAWLECTLNLDNENQEAILR